ncbi:hypothetical protein HJ052_19300 [Vibrio parahaemolyticus]|nr:hypothetical protein [Vibrio parahaemolyticus]
MTEQMNVPKLRFSEFDSMLGLSYFGELVNDITYGPRFSAEDYCSDGNVRTIRGTDMGANGEIKYHQVPTAQLDVKTVNRHELKDGDLVMITTADCGITSVYREQPIKHICSAYAVKINLNENADSTYFKYFYQTSKAQYEVSRFIRKATVSNLPGSDINRIRHYPPSLQEQQKIASFLSKVDEKIALLTEKKDKLTEYKKGVMQQLFNGKWQEQDGQLTFIPPTLRFKADDGSEFPDWEEKKLGDLFSISAGGDISKEHSNSVKTDKFKYPVFANAETNKGLHSYSDIYKISQPCLTVSGRGSLGNAVFRDEPFYPIVRLLVLKAALPVDLKFYEYAINKLNIFNESTGVPQLTAPQLRTYAIVMPCIEEQKKIARAIESLDRKIDLVLLELEKAKEWKKGLLQQMFV